MRRKKVEVRVNYVIDEEEKKNSFNVSQDILEEFHSSDNVKYFD